MEMQNRYRLMLKVLLVGILAAAHTDFFQKQ